MASRSFCLFPHTEGAYKVITLSSAFKRWILAGGLALGLLTTAGYHFAGAWHDRLVSAETQVKAARTETQRALAQAAQADVYATAQEARGDSLEAAVARLRAVARGAQHADSASHAAYAVAAYTSADTCKVVVAAANRALADIAYTDTLDKARADTAELAADSYKQSARAALNALAALEHGAAHLDSASGELTKQAKGPSFLARIAPKTGAGVAAGINPQGHFDTVAGLTLSWTFGGHR